MKLWSEIVLVSMYFICMILYIVTIFATNKKMKVTLDPIVNTRVNTITTKMYSLIKIQAGVQAVYNALCIEMLIRIMISEDS